MAHMTQFTIYFEAPDMCQDDIHALCRGGLTGYTLYEADGVWQGAVAPSYVLVFIGRETRRADVHLVAKAIKIAARQDVVLVTEHSVSMHTMM